MRIYLVKRTDDWGYDDYDSFVCYAKSAYSARQMHPDEEIYWDKKEKKWIYKPMKDYDSWSNWVTDLESLEVKLIGEANKGISESKVILASFNAG
jgi:hypothetical protein